MPSMSSHQHRPKSVRPNLYDTVKGDKNRRRQDHCHGGSARRPPPNPNAAVMRLPTNEMPQRPNNPQSERSVPWMRKLRTLSNILPHVWCAPLFRLRYRDTKDRCTLKSHRRCATSVVPRQKGQTVEQLDPEQLKFVEILAKLMAENEVFKEEYTAEDFAAVIDWLTKLRAQIDITIDSLQDEV